ncbi:MAG: hypothetical protein ACLP8B_08010, partial [Xanthobacteraceae bacterium]
SSEACRLGLSIAHAILDIARLSTPQAIHQRELTKIALQSKRYPGLDRLQLARARLQEAG